MQQNKNLEKNNVIERPKLRQRWKPGNIIQLDLWDGTYGFGLVLKSPKVGFFDYHITEDQFPADINVIQQQTILFRKSVFKWCITQYWPIIGKMDYDPSLDQTVNRFSYDHFSRQYHIWTPQAKEIPATWEECKDLEQAHVVDYGIVEQRLRDHFAGRPCFFVEQDKPDFSDGMTAKQFYAQYGYDFTGFALSQDEGTAIYIRLLRFTQYRFN